jgi:tRNA pseudouridine38-40 synthase
MLSGKPSNYRYFVEFAFNGKRFHGWQIQPNALTVQEEMNKSFSTLLGHAVNLIGAGRTDTGVHASHFVAHFDYPGKLEDLRDFTYRINRFLKNDIRIDRIVNVDGESHARFSAVSRTYHYLIGLEKDPFMEDFSWRPGYALDIEIMSEASGILPSYNDFTSFARLHADANNNLCNVIRADWNRQGEYLVFSIKANRFLRNMVRAIVGTLADVGSGKITVDDFRQIIELKDRSRAGQSAPPQGLFLTHIEYPDDIFPSSPRPPFYRLFK